MRLNINYAAAFQQFLLTQVKIKDISHVLCFYWDLPVCVVPQSYTCSGFTIDAFYGWSNRILSVLVKPIQATQTFCSTDEANLTDNSEEQGIKSIHMMEKLHCQIKVELQLKNCRHLWVSKLQFIRKRTICEKNIQNRIHRNKTFMWFWRKYSVIYGMALWTPRAAL